MRHDADARVWIFGAAGGMEEKIAVSEGIGFQSVPVIRLPGRKLSGAMLSVPGRLAGAVVAAKQRLRECGARAVLGFGGYVSFPTAAAARMLRIPFFLHEQNTSMGKSNRILVRFARGVFTSFENTEGVPAGKGIPAGNPARFEGEPRPEKREAKKQLGLDLDRAALFVFGGSQGAMSLNRAALEFAEAAAPRDDLQLLIILGPKNFEELKPKFDCAARGAVKICALPYLNEMPLAYAAADLTVCRAGATTITELQCMAAPAVLVPYPHAAENHQEKNARYLADRGAALMVLDSELSGDMLLAVTDSLLGNREKLDGMARACGSLYRAGAAAAMYDNLLRHCAGNSLCPGSAA